MTMSGDNLPAHLHQDYAWEHELVIDSTRIRQELGYVEQVTQEEGLRRTIAWQRANPPETFDPSLFDYPAEDSALAKIVK